MSTLADGVLVYVQSGGWFLNNTGVIGDGEHCVLVDTCATEARTRRMLAATGIDTSGSQITAVITHMHGDHANGAGLIARCGGTVRAAPAAVDGIAAGPHTFDSTFHGADWGTITPPETMLPITPGETLTAGGHTVQLHPAPQAAHTTGDAVVWLPEARVLFTGDLLFAGSTPLLFHGSVTGWLAATEWWRDQFPAATVVPGHGPPCAPDSQAVTEQTAYLSWLAEVTARAAWDDLDALAEQARHRWPHWAEAERHPVNLRAAHAETHGYPFDGAAALAAMRQETGGRIDLSHL